MSLMAQPLASVRSASGAKAALTGIKWHVHDEPPVAPMTLAAQGDLGKLRVSLSGRGAVDAVTFAWQETGGLTPFDLPAALRFLGVRLAPVACGTGGDAFGDGQTTEFRAEMAGAVPFRLTVNERAPPLGAQEGWYNVTVYPGGRIPTVASLRAENPSSDPLEAPQWQQCQ